MIHIGICDDDLIFSDYLQTKIETIFANTNESYQHIFCFPPEAATLQWIFPL